MNCGAEYVIATERATDPLHVLFRDFWLHVVQTGLFDDFKGETLVRTNMSAVGGPLERACASTQFQVATFSKNIYKSDVLDLTLKQDSEKQRLHNFVYKIPAKVSPTALTVISYILDYKRLKKRIFTAVRGIHFRVTLRMRRDASDLSPKTRQKICCCLYEELNVNNVERNRGY